MQTEVSKAVEHHKRSCLGLRSVSRCSNTTAQTAAFEQSVVERVGSNLPFERNTLSGNENVILLVLYDVHTQRIEIEQFNFQSNRIAQTECQKIHCKQGNLRIRGQAMRQAQTLSNAEIKRVLAYCATRQHSVRDATIVLFSIHAGLRAKELAALRVGDVYDDAGAVRSSFILAAEQTKGRRTRTVYINKTLQRQLAHYLPHVHSAQPSKPLFASQKASAFRANTICQLLLNIYKACGLKDASSHSGRRTFITRLASKGVGVRVLAELAGHSSIATTQRYIDVNSEQLANAVELV